MKSSVDEIRARFDNDVERFSNLETGQSATVDAPLALELVAQAAAAATPLATRLLDIGCGAGNFSLRYLQVHPLREVTLIDLSRPMLDRAVQRIEAAHGFRPTAIQGDIREVSLGEERFDVILAGAVLHHLRGDEEWEATFAKLFAALSPGGSLWIFDMVAAATPQVHGVIWRRYGEYLTRLQDEAYRDKVFAYIEKEDTPRALYYQLRLLERVGFAAVEVLHANTGFAAFGAVKYS